MTDMNGYWNAWSPYWSYFENNMLDIEGINKLAIDIVDPALVVGAGQGLLVEQLLRKGFRADGVDLAPQMIKYAKERRNIDLIHADARQMPFADDSYRTCIVATGGVDFMDDEDQIASIVDEAQRVTDASGKILIAFYRFHPRVEKLMRYTGLITESGFWRQRRTYQFMNLGPREFLAAIRKEPHVSVLGALCVFIECQMFLPRKERRSTKNWDLLWKRVRQDKGCPDILIETTPELCPYRVEPQIRALFERLSRPIHQVFPYDSCNVVQLEPKHREETR
jgi:hypothetical protein